MGWDGIHCILHFTSLSVASQRNAAHRIGLDWIGLSSLSFTFLSLLLRKNGSADLHQSDPVSSSVCPACGPAPRAMGSVRALARRCGWSCARAPGTAPLASTASTSCAPWSSTSASGSGSGSGEVAAKRGLPIPQQPRSVIEGFGDLFRESRGHAQGARMQDRWDWHAWNCAIAITPPAILAFLMYHARLDMDASKGEAALVKEKAEEGQFREKTSKVRESDHIQSQSFLCIPLHCMPQLSFHPIPSLC
mmetsp:Transcript_15634/g.39864  ORF Transcript_15634/g.39864 Transcript_15634/m.39864 type:complete len:249 (+) Transcript_15634:1393-2139(+)